MLLVLLSAESFDLPIKLPGGFVPLGRGSCSEIGSFTPVCAAGKCDLARPDASEGRKVLRIFRDFPMENSEGTSILVSVP